MMSSSRTPTLAVATSLAFGLVLAPSREAHAEDISRASQRAAIARELDRPYTMVEVSAGLFALPAAEVCPTSLDRCVTGETSLALGIRNFYRTGPFAIGAGIMWATTLGADSARGDPSLERDHTRRYFLVEGLFRYSFYRSQDWEVWAGGGAGGIIVNDSWSVLADREPPEDTAFVGPRTTTVGTEGFTLGAGAGADYLFAENWSIGATLRYMNWFLTGDPEFSPTGDVASLSGRVDTFELSVLLAYRIAL
jgi:hypothetical protein